MQAINQSSSNAYFEYTPMWSNSEEPLPLKVAGAVATVFTNLAKVFANAFIGLGSLIASLFSSGNTDSLPIAPGGADWPGSVEPSAPEWDPAWGPWPGN